MRHGEPPPSIGIASAPARYEIRGPGTSYTGSTESSQDTASGAVV